MTSHGRTIAIGALLGVHLGVPGAAFAEAPTAATTVFEATTPVAALVADGHRGAPSGTLRFGVRNVSENERPLGEPVLCAFGVGDTQLYAGSPKILPLGDKLALAPMAMREVQITIQDIPSPGKYKGKLCFSGSKIPPGKDADGKSLPDKPELPPWKLDVDFSLVVKTEWWWALGAIFVGVVASEVLRAWLSRGRKRLVQRINVRKLAERLKRLRDKTQEAIALSAIVDVEREIGAIEADLEDPSPSTTDADVESLAVKLPLVELWVDLRGSILRLDPGQKRDELLAGLSAPEDLIRAPRAPKAELETSLKTLKTLSVKQAQREAQQKAIADLDSMVRDASRRDIASELGPIREGLEAARSAWTKDQRDTVDTLVDTARRGLARLLTKELRADIDKAISEHFKDAEWASLKTDVKVILDVPSADAQGEIEQYQKAYRRYASGRASVLVRALDERLALPYPEAMKAKLTSAREALEPVRTETAFDGASSAIKTALDLLALPLPDAGPGERLISGGYESGFDAPMGYLLDAPSLPEMANPSAEKLTSRLRAYDLAAAFTLFVVAALSGLRFLWAASDTWGSPSDWLTAILWGFGVQATGNAPFEGITALRERLSKLSGG